MKVTSFIQKTLFLDGSPWRFHDRPYIFPILNNTIAPRTVLIAGRQVEKSTILGGKTIAGAIQLPGTKRLYVSPTAEQTAVFSRSKVEDVLKASKALSREYFNFNKGNNVKEKAFNNGSRVYFRSAYNSADSIRGITSSDTCIDEVQDIMTSVIPIIEECSSHIPDATFTYSGTPKTLDGTLERYWQRSNQQIWLIKCLHCNHWNFPGMRIIRPPVGTVAGKPGLWCEKCDREIYSIHGVWVAQRPGETFTVGYHLPQIILPPIYINWTKLFNKILTYPKAELMNEVFGVSWDSAEKPITKTEIIACCSDLPISEIKPGICGPNDLFMGIDWGSGGHSFTVLSIGGFVNGKYHVFFVKRFIGLEAEVDFFLGYIVDLARKWGVRAVAPDWGFGFHLNGILAKRLAKSKIITLPIMHSTQKKFMTWNGRWYTIDRTEAMASLFMSIKEKRIVFPKQDHFETFISDFTNVYSEYNYKTRRLQYDHGEDSPDDTVHAINYAYILALKKAGKIQVSVDESRLSMDK